MVTRMSRSRILAVLWDGNSEPRMPLMTDLPPIDTGLPPPNRKRSSWRPGWSATASIVAVIVWIVVGVTTGHSYFPALVAALIIIIVVERTLRRRTL